MLKNRLVSRKKDDEKYGGGPCDLVMANPTTYRQVIQYYYYLTHTNQSVDFWNIVQQIASVLKNIWSAVNPRLLITNECLYKKIKNLLSLVIYINLKNGKTYIKSNLDAKLDKIFDISICTCSSDILPCTIEKRVQEHILCLFPKNAKVPIEDLEYLCNQKSKTGYKLSSIDEMSGKGDRRVRHEQQLHQENIKVGRTSIVGLLSDSPEHTSNFSNNEEQDTWKLRKKPSEDFSILKLTQYTGELLRSKCSSNLGLTFAKALLHDIKHLLRPEVDISHVMIDKHKLDWEKEQGKGFSENSELCENTQFICLITDENDKKKTVKYGEKQILSDEESVTEILPEIEKSNTETPSFLLDNIKSEVEVKEEVVEDYFETSSEVFVQDMQEEYGSSLQNSLNSSNSSSCDVDSSPSMMESPWIDFQVLSKARELFGSSPDFPIVSPTNSSSRRSRICRKMLSPETKYRRIRELNNEASSRYRAKKKMERVHLCEVLRNEQERNVQLKRESKRLIKEYSNMKKMLKFYASSKRNSPSYSSD